MRVEMFDTFATVQFTAHEIDVLRATGKQIGLTPQATIKEMLNATVFRDDREADQATPAAPEDLIF